jgi:hypothetical protein
MAIGSRVCSALVGVIGLWLVGEIAIAAPIRPEKDKDEGYSKKLVGTWLYKDDKANGALITDITFEFKSDGGLKVSVTQVGVTLNGSWKTVKENGKTLTVDIEMTQEGLVGAGGGPQKRTLSVTFEDIDTVVVSAVGEKEEPRTLRRKP